MGTAQPTRRVRRCPRSTGRLQRVGVEEAAGRGGDRLRLLDKDVGRVGAGDAGDLEVGDALGRRGQARGRRRVEARGRPRSASPGSPSSAPRSWPGPRGRRPRAGSGRPSPRPSPGAGPRFDVARLPAAEPGEVGDVEDVGEDAGAEVDGAEVADDRAVDVPDQRVALGRVLGVDVGVGDEERRPARVGGGGEAVGDVGAEAARQICTRSRPSASRKRGEVVGPDRDGVLVGRRVGRGGEAEARGSQVIRRRSSPRCGRAKSKAKWRPVKPPRARRLAVAARCR